MGRRLRRLAGTSAVAMIVVACNAILGNESAVFAPESSDAEGDAGGADGVGALDAPADGPSTDADDAGPCVDTRNNPRHCGSCGHDCLGGACVDGTCQPVTLANDDGEPVAVAISPTHVYWTNAVSGDIKRVPIAGGAVETVFDGAAGEQGRGFVVHQGNVYFARRIADGGVVRCPESGCAGAAVTIVPNLDNADFVTVSGTSLLFVENKFDGRVARCTLPSCGALDVVAPAEGFPLRAAAAGDTVAWSTLTPAGGNVRARIGAGAPFDALAGAPARTVALSGDEIVFAHLAQGPVAVPRVGGAARQIAGDSQTEYLVVEGADVYYTDTLNVGSVLRCPIAGCDAGAPLATSQARPRGIAVDGKSVYWVNSGVGGAGGAVMRVAK